MDIGPINAIQPISGITPRRDPDLGGVFEVEFRHQQQNESDSSARRPSRGLEDEEAEDEILSRETSDSSIQKPTINFFA